MAPTAKARELQSARRTRQTARGIRPGLSRTQAIEESDDDYEDEGGHEDDANTLEQLLELVKDLKVIIEEQSQVIKNVQNEVKELKEEQQAVKEQNHELKAQVSALAAPLPSTRSWASIAAAQDGREVVQPSSSSRHLPRTTDYVDALHCTIDTSRVAEADAEKTSPGMIRSIIEKEMRATNEQSTWRCRAVTRDVKNTSRVKITCRDENEQQMVKQVAETKVAAGVRVLRDELYPVKVDNVNRQAVLDEAGTIRSGAAESIGQENETTVAKVSWLSKRNTPKAYGSMVVYVTKASDANRLLRDGFFHVAGESGYTAVFERRPRPEQCFNCQELGHKAFQCQKTQKCARCSKSGHRHTECAETVVKCVPCGGPHESFSRNCRKLYPSQHE